jgi:NADPH:quinone reductase-like Zn-dependent oxidoreductase
MKKISSIVLVALFLSATGFTVAQAGNTSPTDSSATLNYIEFTQLGNPADVLQVKQHSSTPLKDGEIRVRVLAAPINPSDLLQIAGNYGVDPALPSNPGSEGLGRVLETSAQVQHLSVGQLVLLVGGSTWRDEIVAPATNFVPLPQLGDLDSQVLEQLAMSAVNPISALLMLTSFVELKEGQWLVQSAANSAVGGYVIQLAKQRGIKTVNVVRREGLAEELMAKGADVVLIDGPDLNAQIASATGQAPIALAIDAVGGATYGRLANSLEFGGTLVAYGVLSGKAATVNTALTIFNDVRLRGFWLSKWYETATSAETQAAFGQIIPLIASGALKADVDSRFTVDKIKQAVTRAGQSGRNGKVLIVPKAR